MTPGTAAGPRGTTVSWGLYGGWGLAVLAGTPFTQPCPAAPILRRTRAADLRGPLRRPGSSTCLQHSLCCISPVPPDLPTLPSSPCPTLRSACDAAGARRSLAVEIKVLRTDAARQRFIDAVASFRRRAKARLDGSAGAALPSCRQLGWAGVISFPHHFAACFGEYGSAEWARWAAEFRAHGIPVRACHCLFLSLVG